MAESTLSECVHKHARERPEATAYIFGHQHMSWYKYDAIAMQLTWLLRQQPFRRGDRVALLVPDGFELHVALLALERAGLVAMAIGPRAGAKEVEHLIKVSGAKGLVSLEKHNKQPVSIFAQGLETHIVLDRLLDGSVQVNSVSIELPMPSAELWKLATAQQFSAEELFLLNSTSGTTGMPKCVAHTSHRWFYYHQLVLQTASFNADDVFMSCISGTFGFGLWTSRFTPTILGAPCVIAGKFSADDVIESIHREKVTVLAAVSTQFIMMLNSSKMDSAHLESLRLLYTGGEAVPHSKSLQFEQQSGAKVLQFYGSNETGALSATTVDDSQDQRLRTAGRALLDMSVRLYDEKGQDVTVEGFGRAACRGKACSLGYFNDEKAQKALFTPDGWMLTGDLVRIDDTGYLHVEGRASDFIIRGGKNISAIAVEEALLSHPNIKVAAAIGYKDEIFGERVCAIVELKDPEKPLELKELQQYLLAHGYSVEYLPEILHSIDIMPVSSGGKIAKGELRKCFGG